MKTDVKKAVSAARDYLQSLQDAMGGNIEDLRLEEVEISEDEKHWFVTLGFTRPTEKAANKLGEILALSQSSREYKILKIDSETGEVQSMKIREV